MPDIPSPEEIREGLLKYVALFVHEDCYYNYVEEMIAWELLSVLRKPIPELEVIKKHQKEAGEKR